MTTPGDVQATPEMVEQLGELEEFEVTEKGVRPLSSQNQAEPLPQASPDGAHAEPASSQPESQPSQTAQTPTQQVVGPPPVVEVIPGPSEPPATSAQQPAAAQAPVEGAPVTGVPEAAPEEEVAALERLDAWIKQQREEYAEEARRSVQSQHDRQNAQVARQLQETQARIQELTQQNREILSRDLTDAERAKVQETWAQQDERAQLDSYRAELVDYHKSIFVDSLLLEYEKYGVAREAIEAIETPEEMELHCEQQKSGFLEKKLEEGQAISAVSTERPPEPPATLAAQPTQAPAAQPQPNAGVPAGAEAPSDVGSGGAPQEGTKFSEEASSDAMKENLRNMRWDTVLVRQT